ncbi:PhzF family phenazine biosynthesis protein [Paradevosia shaoguanensis]|uniref:PhzF family phenazine biosynthesis protein n=1 Tax=Paradevosia shaoguanensis TaxID=1335043 RepID=UPI003C715A22
MKLRYQILDVFTSEAFKGNPLAVVADADALDDAQMQTITREFNLPETIFFRTPKDSAHNVAARIFTPGGELPFAGHPTVGAAVALGIERGLDEVTIEEKIGLIRAQVAVMDGRRGRAVFELPQLPAEAGAPPERETVARALGLDVGEIGCGAFALSTYSAGVSFHLVPVRDADVLARIKVNLAEWNEAFPHGRHSAYIFTETPGEDGNDFGVRMLSPALVGEDPATGSAAAAFMGLLALHAPVATGEVRYAIRQGYEMGRPSRIDLVLTMEDGMLVRGQIGGDAVIVARGELDWA